MFGKVRVGGRDSAPQFSRLLPTVGGSGLGRGISCLLGSLGWSKKAWGWAKRNKWNIALTAVSFVPGVGAAAWAVRGAVWGFRAYRIARAARSGADLARFGAVSVRTANLAGRFYTGRGSRMVDGVRYSRDRTRRYRAPRAKVHSGKIQAELREDHGARYDEEFVEISQAELQSTPPHSREVIRWPACL